MKDEVNTALELIEGGKADDTTAIIAELASRGEWDSIYFLSASAGRELSVLFDAENVVHVDWGGPGLVPLHPPLGISIPFRLWVHTHPHGHAYWSSTDRQSIAQGTIILEQAQVLGGNGILSTTRMENPSSEGRLDASGPLARWTEEQVLPWEEWQLRKQRSTSEVHAEVSA